jgi:tetratricopeptide (TPR) repeat protein
MKQVVLILAAIFISSASFSQSKNKKQEQPAAPAPPPAETEILIYNTAMKYGDFDAARYTLYSLIARHPENTSYLDSLIRIYFMTQNWAQCVLAGMDYIQKDTANAVIMEMMAISNSNLARNKDALDLYEKVYRKTGNLYHAYQIAVQQYIMQRYGECAQMIDIIVNDPASATEQINIDIDQARGQQVPIRASALNLRGVMLKEINMPEKAKENFEAALAIAPDFVLAKNNLEEMKKAEVKPEEKKPEPVKKGK